MEHTQQLLSSLLLQMCGTLFTASQFSLGNRSRATWQAFVQQVPNTVLIYFLCISFKPQSETKNFGPISKILLYNVNIYGCTYVHKVYECIVCRHKNKETNFSTTFYLKMYLVDSVFPAPLSPKQYKSTV